MNDLYHGDSGSNNTESDSGDIGTSKIKRSSSSSVLNSDDVDMKLSDSDEESGVVGRFGEESGVVGRFGENSGVVGRFGENSGVVGENSGVVGRWLGAGAAGGSGE